MKDKIAWALLAKKNRTHKKMKELAQNFDKRKHEANLSSDAAIALMNDVEKAMRMGAEFITYIDEDYPEILREIAYPPAYLYVRGNKKLLKHPLKVTVAGSREATVYGMNVAANFAHELASNKICVVSGGAKGVDSAAIRGAMRVGGDIVVVIGTGIDVDYPPENKELFSRVAEKGVIVSEFDMGMGPFGQNFPIRNRVMTALGDSVVIVEAAERSGALISASHATEQGKTLFAVPGNIDSPNSQGTNALIRDGAQMALSGYDIVSELMERQPDSYRAAQGYSADSEKDEAKEDKEQNLPHLSPYENAVINAIKSGKVTYDEILEFCEMETNKLTSVLTIMEIKGIIKLAFNNRYKITN